MKTIRIDWRTRNEWLVSETEDGVHFRVMSRNNNRYYAHSYASAFMFAYWVAGVPCVLTLGY